MPPEHNERHLKLLGSYAAEKRLLDWQHVSYSYSLTASTERKINLEDFVGQVPFMFVFARADDSTISTLRDYVHIGNRANVDIQDANQKSLIYKGDPINADLQQFLAWNLWGSNRQVLGDRVYFIPFCKDPVGCLSGETYEYLSFDKKNKYLIIKPDAAETKGIVSVNLTNPANDGGSYSITWGNACTIDLAFNAAVATMKAAIEDLPIFRNTGAKVTCSATAVASFTITISNCSFDFVGEYGPPVFNVQDLNDGAVAEIVTSISYSTKYLNGMQGSGSTYSINVFVPRFADVRYAGGRFSSKVLAVEEDASN